MICAEDSVQRIAETAGLHRNANGSYSPPASALTDATQKALAGFTYLLPSGWTAKTFPGVIYKMAFGREQDGNPASIIFQEIAFDGNLGQLESKFLKEAPANLAAQNITNFKIINMSAFETTSNLMGLQAVTQAQRPDGGIARQLFYFFERRDGKKVCVICSVVDQGTTYDAEFDAIMKTFRVTK